MQIREATIKYRKVGEIDNLALDCPEKAFKYIQGAFDERPDQESMWVIGLDRKHKAKFRHLVTLGTVSNSLVHPREVFKPLILAGCSGFICAHNHPSGDPSPSAADIKVTRQLRDAANVIGINMIDHVVCGEVESDPTGRGFYSFQESGLL